MVKVKTAPSAGMLGLVPYWLDLASLGQGAVPVVEHAHVGVRLRSAALTAGAQPAAAAGDGFGVRRGDVRYRVGLVFGMVSGRRGWLTQLRLLSVAGASMPLRQGLCRMTDNDDGSDRLGHLDRRLCWRRRRLRAPLSLLGASCMQQFPGAKTQSIFGRATAALTS
jgi:hypothetical protein